MKSYTDLLLENDNDKDSISYEDLLNTEEWNAKRTEIIKRDKHVCTVCGKTSTMSHYDSTSHKVHHLWFGEKIAWVKSSDGTHNQELVPVVTASSQPYSLHVHHHYYVLSSLPWEYPNDALITLCNWCHWEFHKNNVVPVFFPSRVSLNSLVQSELGKIKKRSLSFLTNAC